MGCGHSGSPSAETSQLPVSRRKAPFPQVPARVARLAVPPLHQPRVHRAAWGPPEALSPPPTPSPLGSLSSRSSWDLSHLLTSAHSHRSLGF